MSEGVYKLDLLGTFRLTTADGVRVSVRSKRSRVLLAMLASSRSGERSRRWLQERLWGSRERYNSQASIRRELSNLRRIVNCPDCELLIVERETVSLNLSKVIVDIRDPARIAATREDFLEGIDIAGEEGFEDWLRDERQSIDAAREMNGRKPADLASSQGLAANAEGAPA